MIMIVIATKIKKTEQKIVSLFFSGIFFAMIAFISNNFGST